MNTLYALVAVLSLGVFGGSLLAMVSRRLRRRAILAFGLSAIAFIVSISLFSSDQPAGVKVASQTETDTSKAEVARSDVAVPVAKGQLPPSPAAGSPGTARICLTDKDIHLGAKDEIVIPATTVFEDDGPNTGKSDDPSTWHYEIKEGFKFPAQFVTLTAVSLRKSKPCSEANVQMLTGAGATEAVKRASDKHIFVIDDVLDYPIPTARPPIEIGKLIDDLSVQAMLITDVTQAVARPAPALLDDAANAASCLAGAKKLAVYLGGGTGQQRSMNVEIGVGPDNVTYGCPFGPKQRPDFAVYWEGQARPKPNTIALIGKGGEFVTGATRAELVTETSACVADALKPNAAEMADREIRGVKIECQAFARDGGGGSVTIYRRFGSNPAQPEISAEARTAADQVSRDIKAEDDKKTAEALRFAQWYQDRSIPQNVKTFAMMAARVISLQQRCPSSKSHDDKIAQWASDAGVKSSDIVPGGRYASLMTMMLEAMKAGAAKESVADACEAIKKYD